MWVIDIRQLCLRTQAERHSDVDFLVPLKNGEKGVWSSGMMVIIPSTGDTQKRK